jgi:hypothetical protein
MYVSYDSGIDQEGCGAEDSPCRNIPYALERAGADQEVRVSYSIESQIFSYSLPGKLFALTGLSMLSGGIDLYPQILMNYTQVSVLNFSQRCQGTLSSFRLLVNASAQQVNRFFYYQNANGNNAYIIFQFVLCLLY